MPKIIENLPRRLTEEARRQVLQQGYASLTMRSVAKSCGIGVGTVYNYYASKDALVAAFMLEDWMKRMDDLQRTSDISPTPEPVVQAIYDHLIQFLNQYSPVFQDPAAMAGFSASFSHYHGLLRSQLAAPLRGYCKDEFTAEFIAEAMLVWTVSGKSFAQLYDLVSKLL